MYKNVEYSPDLQIVINKTLQYLLYSGNNEVKEGHFIYYLLESKQIKILFESLNVEVEELKRDIYSFLKMDIKYDRQINFKELIISEELLPVLEKTRILYYKIDTPISALDFFIILLSSYKEEFYRQLLSKYGIEEYVLKSISEEVRKEPRILEEEYNHYLKYLNKEKNNNNKENKITDSLFLEGKNNINKLMNEKPEDFKFITKMGITSQVLVGRETELERIYNIIGRKTKNNCLLIGDSGVGKTTIIEGLSNKIHKKEVPDFMKNKTIYSLNVNSLISGTKYRGEFEENLEKLIKFLSNKKNIILFIDEFHTLFGLGGNSSNNLDAIETLKPCLSSGEVQIIAVTTYEDAKKTIFKNKALERRFQSIDVKESTKEETLEILKGIKNKYEEYHNISISNENLITIISLCEKYIPNKFFPDKRIDIIDEVGSYKKVKKIKTKQITSEEISIIVEKISNVKVFIENKEEINELLKLEENINKKVFGQEEAVNKITEKILIYKSGLIEQNKPIGSFLLSGPSGTGKTELARQLSQLLNLKLIRLDMGEYSESIAVSKLFGTSAGYIGYEDGGYLINQIKRNPNRIILFDEIEKAHPKVINSLLQLLEEAEGHSGNGTKVSFKNVLFLFTTNAGSRTHIESTMGFNNDKGKGKQEESIKSFFTPEFRNRMDEIIFFNYLEKKHLKSIIQENVNSIQLLLKEKYISLKLQNQLIDHIIESGYNEEYGARELKRAMDKIIKKEIAKQILFKNVNNKTLILNIDKNKKLQIKEG